MAEAGKVRLVLCPKCENVLPELENYSVYQCGGCGAVLRANNHNLESGGPSEKPDEEQNATPLEDPGAADVEVKSSAGLLMPAKTAPEKNGTACHENASSKLEGSIEKPGADNASELNAKDNGSGGGCGDPSSQVGSLGGGSDVSQPSLLDHKATETRTKTARFQDHHLQNDIRSSRILTSQFPHEGSSCSRPRSFSYSQEMPSQRPNGVDQKNRFRYLEDDRVELLRKLDELKDQLSRSCDVTTNARDNAPSVRRTFSSDINGYSSSARASAQLPAHETHLPPHPSRYQELFPPYSRQYHPYDRPPHLCADSEPYEPFLHRGDILHQPACSCFRCYRKHHEVVPPIQSAACCRNQFQNVRRNHFPYNPENSSSFSSHYHNIPERHIGLPSRLNCGISGSFSHFPRRGLSFTGVARRQRPIAGGAPIIACCNCFELLQLPDKALRLADVQQKIQCGKCSALIPYKVAEKKLVLPFHEEADTAVEADGFIHPHSRFDRGIVNFSSDDFDNAGYEFHAMDRVPAKPAAKSNLSQSNTQETDSFTSSSPSITNDENHPTVQHSPPPPGSPLQEHFDYSNNHASNRMGKGNRSSRSDHEKALPSKTMRQNSLNEASLMTELDVSYNDFYNMGGSQDSGDGSKEDDHHRVAKGNGESFLSNFIKKSFKDFTRSVPAAGTVKTSVSVNGHPLPARIIRKAEKFAGPIHPGNYWYDSRAGFWGVMGGPCLGIIPPNIEEFNHPILENCAGGNTGIFVNGRELHKQDLELLATRGLPTDSNRSYIVEISGRVWDEDTGEELECLGKLAPTVEKVKHGFGMKASRATVQ